MFQNYRNHLRILAPERWHAVSFTLMIYRY